jgi:uncharacterized protein
VIEHGVDGPGPHRAARELLLRRPPPLADMPGGELRRPGETAADAAVRLALALDEATLAIQGPPGSGKTTRGADMIVALVRAGCRVGVTANSHKVISHLLDAIHAAPGGADVRLGQRRQEDDPEGVAVESYDGNADARAALDTDRIDVLGGTVWAWSAEAMVGAIDVLVVDEAGQLSLATAIAISPATKSLVLLGDPQQLDQPLKGSHPPGAERSALGHLLEDRATLGPSEGLFLDRTWRLHPTLCAFTSKVYYDGRLFPIDGLERQEIRGPTPFAGSGLFLVEVAHEGNQASAPEEVDAVERVVRSLLVTDWAGREGEPRRLVGDDVLVLAPYNAQVAALRRRLRDASVHRVGTVDKFQGQEAPAVVYSCTSSSPEDAPRGMEFLYDPHRFNVATSRARGVVIVVASPRLFTAECRTPAQMRMVNGLCRFRSWHAWWNEQSSSQRGLHTAAHARPRVRRPDG